MNKFHLKILAENGEIFDGEVNSVNLNTDEGYITVLPKHSPLIGLLAPGKITVDDGNEKKEFEITGNGIIDIRPTRSFIMIHGEYDQNA